MAEIIETPQDDVVSESSLQDQVVDETYEQDTIEINDAQLIRQLYEGQTSDSIQVVVNNTNKTITANILQNQYASKLAFPSVGSDKLLYVDLSDNSLWRFDTTSLIYVCVGRDYEDIGVISGGNA